MKKLILASTSTLFGSTYLEYLLEELEDFFTDTDTITFFPYAQPSGISYDEYTSVVRKAFAKIGKKVVGLHSYEDPLKGINEATGIFTGGGNTFLLVATLYRLNLLQTLKLRIESGVPYLGTSAGSNIAGPTMQTTNDMPIVYPPSFNTLDLVNFNLNAHYLDPDPKSTHKGETRETRIKEYHCFNATPVVGLREGSYIKVEGAQISLQGTATARIFKQGKAPYESKELLF